VARRRPRRRLGGDDRAGGPSSDDARTRDLVQFDLGQATMSIMLAAADLGIGSAHAGVHDQELARRLLGFPGDRFCALLVTLGVPADHPLTPIRRPVHRRGAPRPLVANCRWHSGWR
jgi:nitroreductase